MEYTSHRTNEANQYGTFLLKIMGDEVQLRGSFFMSQGAIDDYLFRRGIALRRSLIDFEEIRRRTHPGGILLIEEICYRSNLSSFSISRIRELLKVATSSTSEWQSDPRFLATKNSGSVLLHARSKDVIEPDVWVPLYRMGNLIGLYENDRPINLDEVEHVIF